MPRLGKKLLILAVSSALALAVGECVTRGVLVSKSGASDFETYRTRAMGEVLPIFEQDIGGEIIDITPNTAQGTQIHINRQGFRGDAVADPKPAGGFRVCFIGGSGCFGTTSSGDNTTIPGFFEAELRKRSSTPRRVEVV